MTMNDIGTALLNEYKVNYPNDINDMYTAMYNESTSSPGFYQILTTNPTWPTDVASLLSMGEKAYSLFENTGKEIGAVSRVFNKVTGQNMFYDLGLPKEATDTNHYLSTYNAKLQASGIANGGELVSAF
jgi:hypothetical protein